MPLDCAEHASNSPYILVLGMGGTISGISENSHNPLKYQAGQVSVENLLKTAGVASPEGLRIVSRQVANIDSQNLTEAHLTELGMLVNISLEDPLLNGLVITHGTDTLEEVGIFLHLTCGNKARNTAKRIVLTGAMLPSNALRSDGSKNLRDALRWASPALDDCPGGVYGVFADKVCLGMDLGKRHATDLDAPLQAAFCSTADTIDPSWLSMVKERQLSSSIDLPIPQYNEWPWVEILTSHAGARAESIAVWLGGRLQGLIVAGTGLGGFHSAWSVGLKTAAEQGIAIVRSSRTGAGFVSSDTPEKDMNGMVASGYLSAPKARIGLQLALNASKQPGNASTSNAWRDLFLKAAFPNS